MHRKAYIVLGLLIVVFLSGCRTNEQLAPPVLEDNNILRCLRLASIPGNLSLYISFKAFPLTPTILLGENGQMEIELSHSLSFGVIEVGLESELPIKANDPNYLYLQVIDRNADEGKQVQIRCLDMGGKNVEFLWLDPRSFTRVTFSLGEMKIYDERDVIFSHRPSTDINLIALDVTNGDVDVQIGGMSRVV